MRHHVPKLDSDKALKVKRTLVTTTTWRQLTGVESKHKGKRKVKETKPRAAKSVPTTSMPTDPLALLPKIIQNQEAILKKLELPSQL
ncbi:hypothetical protein V6N12_050086 [Hibiscus sabdariffa]|uniref:Uncharacterized protein n=1 Tax=Hibiscus sabdariffa TaxID=183260 RepID=A0ABR2GBU3_9ROSI